MSTTVGIGASTIDSSTRFISRARSRANAFPHSIYHPRVRPAQAIARGRCTSRRHGAGRTDRRYRQITIISRPARQARIQQRGELSMTLQDEPGHPTPTFRIPLRLAIPSTSGKTPPRVSDTSRYSKLRSVSRCMERTRWRPPNTRQAARPDERAVAANGCRIRWPAAGRHHAGMAGKPAHPLRLHLPAAIRAHDLVHWRSRFRSRGP